MLLFCYVTMAPLDMRLSCRAPYAYAILRVAAKFRDIYAADFSRAFSDYFFAVALRAILISAMFRLFTPNEDSCLFCCLLFPVTPPCHCRFSHMPLPYVSPLLAMMPFICCCLMLARATPLRHARHAPPAPFCWRAAFTFTDNDDSAAYR